MQFKEQHMMKHAALLFFFTTKTQMNECILMLQGFVANHIYEVYEWKNELDLV